MTCLLTQRSTASTQPHAQIPGKQSDRPTHLQQEAYRSCCLQRGYLGQHVPDRPASLRPWQVSGVGPAVSVAAGRCTAAAVMRSGEVYTWGCPPLGRPGDGFAPAKLAGLDGVKAVKVCVGEYHGAGITDDGRLFIWGSTGDGQPGSRNGISLSQTATFIEGWPDELVATALACGFQHTLVIGRACQGQQADVTATRSTQVAEPHSHSTLSAPASPAVSNGSAAVSLFSLAPTADGLIAQPAGAMLAAQSQKQGAMGAEDGLMDSSTAHDTSAVSVPTITATPENAAEPAPASGSARTSGIGIAKTQSKQTCGQRRLPPWLHSCSELPGESAMLSLDRAWYGQYHGPNMSQVCDTSQLRASCAGLVFSCAQTLRAGSTNAH